MAESTRLELATSGVTGGFSFCTVHECFLNEAQNQDLETVSKDSVYLLSFQQNQDAGKKQAIIQTELEHLYQ